MRSQQIGPQIRPGQQPIGLTAEMVLENREFGAVTAAAEGILEEFRAIHPVPDLDKS